MLTVMLYNLRNHHYSGEEVLESLLTHPGSEKIVVGLLYHYGINDAVTGEL